MPASSGLSQHLRCLGCGHIGLWFITDEGPLCGPCQANGGRNWRLYPLSAEEAAGDDRCPACLGYPRPHKPDLCPPPTRWQRFVGWLVQQIDYALLPFDEGAL